MEQKKVSLINQKSENPQGIVIDLVKNFEKTREMPRIRQVIHEELSEQNENVWESKNIEKELQDYQEANSPGTEGDSASKGDEYAEIMMVNVMGRKQRADLEGKSQDDRKRLRREVKDVALIRIREIAQDEISQEKNDKVYVPVQLWEEARKDEKTDKRQKVNLEEIEEGIVKRRIQYLENIIQGNMKEEGDLRENIIQGKIKEEGDLRGLSPDFRENLIRKAKDIALARIRQVIHEELSEQNENVWESENIEKELKDYQEANSPGTEGDSASKGDEYAEIMMVNVMGRKQKADLKEISQDERKHLRREAKDVALIRIREIAQDEIS
ncbi:probable inactive protein kinase DDB_G0270444 [Palaemon carinicauda]|uniref:probable inactive protein kinase DDB_G0270444 n=1 Tax=Palaemon carinicauda TaxID=392227 RepID=UPI0035B698D3